jgi:hypothetical protein
VPALDVAGDGFEVEVEPLRLGDLLTPGDVPALYSVRLHDVGEGTLSPELCAALQTRRRLGEV